METQTVVFRAKRCTYVGEADRCPYCGSEATEIPSEDFLKTLQDFEAGTYEYTIFGQPKEHKPADWNPRQHPGYVAMWSWARQLPRCFRHPMHMKHSYKWHTGIDIEMTV